MLNFSFPCCLEVVVLWLEKQKQKAKVSMKLMASLAPARAEIEAGVVAKADQQIICQAQPQFQLQLKT